MPDLCYNSLTVEGSEKLIADVKRMLNRPFTTTHDSYNSTTDKMELSDTTYSNPVFAFHNIYNHKQAGVSDEEYLKKQDTTKTTAEASSLSGNNWYDWNVRNWGTKWDVANPDDEEYADTRLQDEGKDFLSYRFNTAIPDYGPSGPPIDAIIKLSTLYPTLNFSLRYEVELGWGGLLQFEAGNINVIDYHESEAGDDVDYERLLADND